MGINLTGQKYFLKHSADQDRDPVDVWTKVNQFMLQLGEEYVFKFKEGKELDVSRDGLTKLYQARRQSQLRRGGRPNDSIRYASKSQNSLLLSLSTGVVSQFAHSFVKLPETLRFDVDLAHLQSPTKVLTFSQLQQLFKLGVILFDPFHSQIQKQGEAYYPESNYKKVAREIDRFKVPAAIEWFDYFSPAWVERFGGDEFVMAAPVYQAEKIPETGGILLILQEEPFDFTNPKHIIKRKLVEEYLDLVKLQRLHT